MNLNYSVPPGLVVSRHRRIYPKLGGDLAQACERLASGLRVPGIVIVLFRGNVEEIEVAAAFGEYFKIESKAFRDLAGEILRGSYEKSLAAASEGCLMFAQATGAK